MDCIHDWKLEKEEILCSLYSTRGIGQYNDPCYGVSCPCDSGGYERIYVCNKCGAQKTEP